jgi:predicted  nucleic acid-binding Zn-ribbon protein
MMLFDRLQGLEREIELTRDESSRLRSQTERLRGERSSLQQRLAEMESTLVESQEELHRLTELIKREREQWAVEHAASKQLTSELTKEVDMLRSALNSSSLQRQQLSGSITDGSTAAVRIRELENEIKILKQDNHSQFVPLFAFHDEMLTGIIGIQVYGTPMMSCRPSCFPADWKKGGLCSTNIRQPTAWRPSLKL